MSFSVAMLGTQPCGLDQLRVLEALLDNTLSRQKRETL